MEDNKVSEFANQYRKIQKRVSLIVMILIISVGIIIFGFGLYFCLYDLSNFDLNNIIIGVVMIVVSILDIILGINFNKIAKKKINNISDKEAYTRYARIHGIK